MNTKQVPILIILLAAGISCVFSIVQKVSFSVFFRRFLITVLVFTIVGWIVKTLLDKAFNNEIEGEEGEESEEGESDSEEGELDTEGNVGEGENQDEDEDDDLL